MRGAKGRDIKRTEPLAFYCLRHSQRCAGRGECNTVRDLEVWEQTLAMERFIGKWKFRLQVFFFLTVFPHMYRKHFIRPFKQSLRSSVHAISRSMSRCLTPAVNARSRHLELWNKLVSRRCATCGCFYFITGTPYTLFVVVLSFCIARGANIFRCLQEDKICHYAQAPQHNGVWRSKDISEFLISALDGGQLHVPVALPPATERLCPLGRRLGGPKRLDSWTTERSLVPPG